MAQRGLRLPGLQQQAIIRHVLLPLEPEMPELVGSLARLSVTTAVGRPQAQHRARRLLELLGTQLPVWEAFIVVLGDATDDDTVGELATRARRLAP